MKLSLACSSGATASSSASARRGTSPRQMGVSPSGKVEAGENLEDALRRELREELGIEADIGSVLWRTEHQYSAPGRRSRSPSCWCLAIVV